MDPNIDFIKFNVDQNGYYRVNYDEKNWNKLTNAFSKLSVLDKTSLLNDAFSLAAAGQLKYAIPLQLSENLKKERELPPWVVASSSLNYLKKYLINTEYYTNLVKFAGTLLHDVLAEVKWEVPENDSFARRKLRVYILLLGCGFNEKSCLTQAGIEIKKWLNDPSHKVHQDIKSVVYKYGMMSIAGLEEWDIMWNRYLSETDAQEKNSLMSGLCSVPQTWLLARLINRAWDKNNVRRQDYFDVLRNIAANPSGTAIVWDYVRENWTMIVDEFGLNDRILGRLIPDITSSFSSRLKLNEMKAFFEMYPKAGAGERNRKEAIENVENNIKWLERNADAVGKWLQQNA